MDRRADGELRGAGKRDGRSAERPQAPLEDAAGGDGAAEGAGRPLGPAKAGERIPRPEALEAGAERVAPTCTDFEDELAQARERERRGARGHAAEAAVAIGLAQGETVCGLAERGRWGFLLGHD